MAADREAKRRSKETLRALALRLGLEMLERQRNRPPQPFSPYRPPQSPEALERQRKEAEEREAQEEGDRKAYYRERYAREKAKRMGKPLPPPPPTPAARRRGREAAKRKAQLEALLALAKDRFTHTGRTT